MRGRPPKPTALKVLSGTFRKDRQNRREPKPTATLPGCPKFLDAMAKAEWRRITPELARLGLLTLIDRASLAAYCQMWSRWQQAEAILQRDGLTFATPNGFLQKRPEVTIARESMALHEKICDRIWIVPRLSQSSSGRDTSGTTRSP